MLHNKLLNFLIKTLTFEKFLRIAIQFFVYLIITSGLHTYSNFNPYSSTVNILPCGTIHQDRFSNQRVHLYSSTMFTLSLKFCDERFAFNELLKLFTFALLSGGTVGEELWPLVTVEVFSIAGT